jgi:DNA mismatch endonuclease (patch repair protein)
MTLHQASGNSSRVPAFPSDVEVPKDVSSRMSKQGSRDTRPEWTLRRKLHQRGLRYRVDAPLPGMTRRRADVLFTKSKVAVFVDGCFWHCCPEHGVAPKSNAEWWNTKLGRNVARDLETNEHLRNLGWVVLRFWEHEDMALAADQVEMAIRGSATDLGRQEATD